MRVVLPLCQSKKPESPSTTSVARAASVSISESTTTLSEFCSSSTSSSCNPSSKFTYSGRKRKAQLKQVPFQVEDLNRKRNVSETKKNIEVKKSISSMVQIPSQSAPRWVVEEDTEENSPESSYEDHHIKEKGRFSNKSKKVVEGDESVGRMFEEGLKRRGLEMVEQEGDGNCLFRAVSLQVYGDPSMHGEIRRRCLDFMAKDESHFSQFVTGEPFQDYINRKRHDGVHGNNPEIQAVSELFNRPVELYIPDNGAGKPLNIFHAEYKTADAPIRLSYHDGNHYNAVIDPLCPTAGLGLGLPGLEPGLADRLQMEKAVEESNRAQLHRAMDASMKIYKNSAADQMYKQKALLLSDMEATDYHLEQAVLASSLESYNSFEQVKKKAFRTSNNSSPQTLQQPQNYSSRTASYYSPPPAAASSSSSAIAQISSSNPTTTDEYPPSVQELVMNGFELSKVIHAYDLIGDNFDDLLSFLLSSGSS